jgi:arylsulfatase A-like enzyme
MALPPRDPRHPHPGQRPAAPPPEEVTINNPIANVPGQPQNPEPPQQGAPGQPLPPVSGAQPGQGLPPTAEGQPGQLPAGDPPEYTGDDGGEAAQLPNYGEGAPDHSLPTTWRPGQPRPGHPSRGTRPGRGQGQGGTPGQLPADLEDGAPAQGLPVEGDPNQDLPAGEDPAHPGRGVATTHPLTSHPHLALHLLNRKRKQRKDKKPNILFILSDDVGRDNVSTYNLGVSSYYTHNIDRIGKEGALFTHSYGQNSCTAGRSAIISGQCPFRIGMTSVGMPGSPAGIPDWMPTMADLLQDQGYRTAQIGKNHLGDWNKHLPTSHGFSYFYGNLYHLNTSEEPFQSEYPKEPAFFEKYGPRGVLECHALDRESKLKDDPRFGPVGYQSIKDTGQLPIERMIGFDDRELLPRMKNFMKEAAKADEPFFLWACTSRMHVWTHLSEGSEGRSNAGLFGDGMVEHDHLVGELLKTLDDLKIADNTIVVWTTDNGAEKASWPDGGSTAFHGEKGNTSEGAFRVPLVMRWPGVIDPGTQFHEMFSFEDFLPTFLDAAGNPDVVEQMKAGSVKRRRRAAKKEEKSGDTWGKVHLDGYSFLPFFLGEVDESPRETFVYFGQSGRLDAVRWRQYKGAFASPEGDIFKGTRVITNSPMLTDLYQDPFNVMTGEGQQYMKFYGERLWTFAPLGNVVAEFMESLHGYQNEFRSSMGAQDLSYDTARVAETMQAIGNRHVMMMDPFQ